MYLLVISLHHLEETQRKEVLKDDLEKIQQM